MDEDFDYEEHCTRIYASQENGLEVLEFASWTEENVAFITKSLRALLCAISSVSHMLR